MRNILISLVGFVSLFTTVPYFLDVLKGKSKPNVSSWSTWTLVNIIIVVSAIAAGKSLNTVVLGISFLVGSLSILLIGLFKGIRKYTRFDATCQSIAIAGVILWQISNNPNFALLFVILTDVFAFIPTIRHAYRYPQEETWITYFASATTALALTLLAKSFTFASIAITAEASLVSYSLVGVILYRRSQVHVLTKKVITN